MEKEEIKNILSRNNLSIINERRVNDCGYMLKVSNGAIINVFDTGNYNVQGRNTAEIKKYYLPILVYQQIKKYLLYMVMTMYQELNLKLC